MGYKENGETYCGPLVLSNDTSGPANSVQLYSKAEWQNKTGSLTVNVYQADSSVTYFVMVK
jgi:hypothetical protein